ncbi:P-loop containing nucleoside triphosphate hydrolase protein [Naviculisporaceae sp. PSN 640]
MAPRKKFVPRQRKRKVLDRQRAQAQSTDKVADDSNAVEITKEDEAAQKRARLREELKPEGVKVSGKKAKRLEKYIDTKLRKDETRKLLSKLAANKIDTSLFSSTRSLGQTKETKKEAISRALREQRAGLPTDNSTTELLYERRKEATGELPVQNQPESSEDEEDVEDVSPAAVSEQSAPKPVISQSVGSGLKRSLQTDDSGRPVLPKRQKRGGVKTKQDDAAPQFVLLKKPEEEYEEWNGFSSESEGLDSVNSEAGSSDSEDSSEEGEESIESSEEGSESEESGEEDQMERRKERSSVFKAWATQQRNEALGYTPVGTGPSVLEIPKPASFKPRPVEQDPLPIELQPTTNITRQTYNVAVTRSQEIQEVRCRLPVVAEEHMIMEAIHNHDVVVICGATGSGKTTQVPQFLFEAGYGDPKGPTPGLIGVTQPRRVAAVSMSKRVGQELGDHSHVVAYQVRFDSTVDPKTAIKFMTDGVLLREVAEDLGLRKYSCIIIDEAHERNVNTDILIGILSRVVKLRAESAAKDPTYKPLKLIIMSATLRIEDLTQNPALFEIPPRVVEIEGREHPVTIHFAKKTHHDYVEDAFRKISRGHKKLPPGGMLVFLTGQAEISRLSKLLKAKFGGMAEAPGPKVRISGKEAPVEVEDVDFGEIDDVAIKMEDDYETFGASDDEEEEKEFELEDEEAGTGPRRMHVLPLYSLLTTKEQMKVFQPPPEGSRLVILATNVAETSLTIPGIRYVFDCGRAKERRYNRFSGVQSFEVGWISKASAKQRAGRAGRTGPGHCWRLYSSAVYERDFPEFAEPEILRTPIEGVVLQLKAMNLPKVADFPFPTPPPRETIMKAERVLKYLSALSPTGKVTPAGSTMSIFPLSPRFARILVVGHLHDCLPYTIALVAGLSAGEIYVPESQAIPAAAEQSEETYRTNEDVIAEDKRARLRQAFNSVHRNFCSLDDRSDAIKLLQVVGEFAHEPTEEWCESHFVRYKVLKEIRQLQGQIADLVRTNIPAFANFRLPEKLDRPSSKQIQALKQMVAAGFIDQVALRADKAPNPPETYRKPRRAIDVPYIPLSPLESGGNRSEDPLDRLVYIHPSSPMAHLTPEECPEYIVYGHLQRAGNALEGKMGGKKPKTRMHALTDLTPNQVAALAKGTPLITYGKPIKEVSLDTKEGVREVICIPYLRAEEAFGGLGWPLPARKITQNKVAGQGWVAV